MKNIQINSNCWAMIDDEDYHLFKEYRWHISKSKKNRYIRTFIISSEENVKRKSLFFQHLIVGRAPKGKRIFFKDGNSLNCQKSNIEFVTNGTAAHQYYNKLKRSKNSTELFKGVVVMFWARIKHNNKIISLGCFESEKEAAVAYNIKAVELYGEKAILNRV